MIDIVVKYIYIYLYLFISSRVLKSRVQKSGRLLLGSEHIQRKFWNFLKWNNAESTKLGPMLIILFHFFKKNLLLAHRNLERSYYPLKSKSITCVGWNKTNLVKLHISRFFINATIMMPGTKKWQSSIKLFYFLVQAINQWTGVCFSMNFDLELKFLKRISQKLIHIKNLSLVRLKLTLASYSNLYKTPITIIKLQKVLRVEGSEYDNCLKFVYFEKSTKFKKKSTFFTICMAYLWTLTKLFTVKQRHFLKCSSENSP